MGDPLWLRAFSAVEGVVGPRVEDFVHGSGFATAVIVMQKARSGVSSVVERGTRDVWHLVNLPAGSDVRKLRNQIGDLDHEVRLLRGTVEAESRKRARASRRAAQPQATEPSVEEPLGSRGERS